MTDDRMQRCRDASANWYIVDDDSPETHFIADGIRAGEDDENTLVQAFLAFDAESAARIAELERERDEARGFLDNAVSKAPEPLRALGEYLGRLLDEDRWPEAERYLNAAVVATLAAQARLARAEELFREIAAYPGTASFREHARTFLAEQSDRPEGGDAIRETSVWREISELEDIYQQPIWIASPKLIHGDSNPLGIAEAYWQDDTGPSEGKWRTTSFDMCNDEWNTISLEKEDVTHFLIPTGPWTQIELEALEGTIRTEADTPKGGE